MMKTKRLTADTLQVAFVILGEWNANSRAPVDASKPDGQKLLGEAIDTAAALERIERRLKRMAEYECNFPMSEAETADAEKEGERHALKVAALLKPWKVTAKLGGDVRGPQVRLMTPKTGRSNSWGGAADGWGV